MKKLIETRAPRSIEELQKEIAVLDAQDTATTKRVSKQLRLEGIDTLDAETVYDELNFKASIMENVSAKMFEREVELKGRGDKYSDIYGEAGKNYADCADMIRKSMTELIRLERYKQKLIKK